MTLCATVKAGSQGRHVTFPLTIVPTTCVLMGPHVSVLVPTTRVNVLPASEAGFAMKK